LAFGSSDRRPPLGLDQRSHDIALLHDQLLEALDLEPPCPTSPAARHLVEALRREPDRQAGHNPAGGWMVVLLLALLLGETAVQNRGGFK
jgi:hypothetical protein